MNWKDKLSDLKNLERNAKRAKVNEARQRYIERQRFLIEFLREYAPKIERVFKVFAKNIKWKYSRYVSDGKSFSCGVSRRIKSATESVGIVVDISESITPIDKNAVVIHIGAGRHSFGIRRDSDTPYIAYKKDIPLYDFDEEQLAEALSFGYKMLLGL